MALSDNIRKLREENGMTQQQMAEQLYVSRQTVCRWENGSRTPDLDMAERIAEIFHVSVDELISAEEKQGISFENISLHTEKFIERKRLKEKQKRILDFIQLVGAVYLVITLFMRVQMEMSVPAWVILIALPVEAVAIGLNLAINRKLEKMSE
ncbi:MAG TPA: helix-turn-helix domain-containing protein [Candidatus Mediterraneibacter vanvlietii]|nr:helix-turn-helix domain-containing protein [Candidatus Mediterraneibacter vanvlietii]